MTRVPSSLTPGACDIVAAMSNCTTPGLSQQVGSKAGLHQTYRGLFSSLATVLVAVALLSCFLVAVGDSPRRRQTCRSSLVSGTCC